MTDKKDDAALKAEALDVLAGSVKRMSNKTQDAIAKLGTLVCVTLDDLFPRPTSEDEAAALGAAMMASSAYVYARMSGAALIPLALVLRDNYEADAAMQEDDGESTDNISDDEMLFAALFTAFSQDASERGRALMGKMERSAEQAQDMTDEAFGKLRGYRFANSLRPSREKK